MAASREQKDKPGILDRLKNFFIGDDTKSSSSKKSAKRSSARSNLSFDRQTGDENNLSQNGSTVLRDNWERSDSLPRVSLRPMSSNRRRPVAQSTSCIPVAVDREPLHQLRPNSGITLRPAQQTGTYQPIYQSRIRRLPSLSGSGQLHRARSEPTVRLSSRTSTSSTSRPRIRSQFPQTLAPIESSEESDLEGDEEEEVFPEPAQSTPAQETLPRTRTPSVVDLPIYTEQHGDEPLGPREFVFDVQHPAATNTNTRTNPGCHRTSLPDLHSASTIETAASRSRRSYLSVTDLPHIIKDQE